MTLLHDQLNEKEENIMEGSKANLPLACVHVLPVLPTMTPSTHDDPSEKGNKNQSLTRTRTQRARSSPTPAKEGSRNQ
jgi:hypothetical protein